MSVPSVFATGHHLDLSLSGSRVTILESLKVNSLAASVHHNRDALRDALNNRDVLPSITPTGSRTVSQESFHNKNSNHHASSLGVKHNISKKNSSHSDVSKKPVEECWKEVEPAVQKDVEEPDHTESEEKDDKGDDQWEDEVDSEDENKAFSERVSSSDTKKRKRKKKKKKSTRHIFKSAKSERLKNTEEIYTDMAVMERQSKMEVFCVPAKIGSQFKKESKKSGTDYLKYVNEKAPSNSQKVQSQVRTDKLLVKTKELLTAVSAKSNSLKEKFRISKTPGDSLSQLKNNLTASADAVTFHFQLPNSGPNVSRKSLNSAPCDKDIPRITKIYLSEKQSKDIWELGMEFPGAPPASPTSDMLKRFEYVPSMRDIRSQRAVKLKLDYLVKIEKQRQEKIKEEKARKDKVHQKERIRELRKQQRREIYALNKEMTEFENSNFREFCRQNGINPDS